METNESSLALTALSPYFTPTPPSQWGDVSAQGKAVAHWIDYAKDFTEIVAGHDFELIADALPTARRLAHQYGQVPHSLDRTLVEALVLPSAFSIEKVDWLAVRGHSLVPSLDTPEDEHKKWAQAQDDAAFDWALAPLAHLPHSASRDKVLSAWIGSVVENYGSREGTHTARALWVSRRLDAIEDARPGLVREWLSSLPRYSPKLNTPQNVAPANASSRDKMFELMGSCLLASTPVPLADWLDPSRFGHPICAHLVMERAVKMSVSSSYGQITSSVSNHDSPQAWLNLSRALALRPEAAAFWKKQSRPGNLVPVHRENKPDIGRFPSQSKVFGRVQFGAERYNNSQSSPEYLDDKLPLEPLGRLLGTTDAYVDHLVSNSKGRQQVIASMMSHPAFMAYGFARFGADLLGWQEASALDGFRDVHGYGAARYALSICSPVMSDLDVCLHRYLRQRKPLCDDAEPKLEGLFVDDRSLAKYRSMELRKVARTTSKEVERRPVERSARSM